MKAYPEYKSSGIDWLGEIPSHWNRVKTQYVFSLASGETINGEDFAKNGKYPVFGGNGIRGYHDEYNLEGEHLIIGRVGALCGNIHITPTKSWVSEHALIASPLINFNIHWLAFLLDIMNLGQYSMASAQPVIAAGNVGKLYIPIPPLEEQEKIAAYLDNVTGKVDALIAEKQKQVEDLRAYRTSLITETVTRGLNPDAPLRSSGIDWLGNIPEHWSEVKLKYVADIQTGSTPSTGIERYWDNPTKDWFTPGDFTSFRLEESNRKLSETAFFERACRVFPKDTVLLVGIGATLGKVGITTVECSANQQINAIKFNKEVFPMYGAYVLSICRNQLNSIANAATLPILNQEQTKSVQIPLPPLPEQQAIAEFLDKKTEKIDALIDELTKQLDELAEYKKAVISEAVTGKVDVRDWKPNN